MATKKGRREKKLDQKIETAWSKAKEYQSDGSNKGLRVSRKVFLRILERVNSGRTSDNMARVIRLDYHKGQGGKRLIQVIGWRRVKHASVKEKVFRCSTKPTQPLGETFRRLLDNGRLIF